MGWRRWHAAIRVKPSTVEVGLKQRYRVTSWSARDRALVNSGERTIWFDEASVRHQRTASPPSGRGKPGLDLETAIHTHLTIKGLFQLPCQATEGLVNSLMRLCQLDLPVAGHTQLPRRDAQSSEKIPRRLRKGSTHVVVDSTALKILGQGKWAKAGFREALLPTTTVSRLCKACRRTVRQHGVSKRRTWRKVYLAVDEAGKDIIGIEVTTTTWGKSEVPAALLDQVEEDVSQALADRAYDSHGCHAAIAERDARATVPPHDGAVSWGTSHLRDTMLQELAAKGISGWRRDSGPHRRSLAEHTRYPLKPLGDSLYSSSFEGQVKEAHVRAAIVNTFTDLGMPKSVSVGQVALAA